MPTQQEYIDKGWQPAEAAIMAARKPKKARFAWTDKKIAQALEMKANGYSHRGIADKFKTTRNVIIGKLDRLKKAGVKAKPKKPKTRLPRKKSKIKVLSCLSRDEIGDGVGLLDLRDDQCHWIPPRHTGRHQKPYTCNGTKAPDKQLCQRHHDKTHIKVPDRTGKRNEIVLKGGQA